MLTVSVMELVVCLSEVIDLMSEEIRDHHKRVACAAYQLAEACGIDGEARRDLVIAAALHDIGGLSLQARKIAALHFEDTNSHAEKGYKLLSVFEPFQDIATQIRYHHTQWNHGKGVDQQGQPIQLESQILLMADRIAVMLTPGIQVLTQVRSVTAKVLEKKGSVYKPELVDVFQGIAPREAFWLNIVSPGFYESMMDSLKQHDMVLSGSHMEKMLDLISNIIDFRSVFTTMHSKGVAIVAEKLACLLDFSEQDCNTIRMAALLHDIGKLAIPTEILDKPGPLSEYERDIIRTHSYYTGRVLASLRGFEKVQRWAASHHENPNGRGYPYGYGEADLCLGSKIMKVADIFVALMEDRPYRKGMHTQETMGILKAMVELQEVDLGVVDVLIDNIQAIEALRCSAALEADQEYKKFSESIPARALRNKGLAAS